MTRFVRVVLVAILAAAGMSFATTAQAQIQNTIPAGAYHLPADGTIISDYLYSNGGVTQRWYVATLHGGRSYCVQSTVDFSSFNTRNPLAEIAVFQTDAATVHPGFFGLSSAEKKMFSAAGAPLVDFAGGVRRCGVPTGADNAEERIFFRVTEFNGIPANVFFRFRISVQETSIYAPWFYTDGNYESYVTLRNVSSQSFSATVTWYNLAGAVLGSTTQLIAGFGASFVGAKATSGLAAGSLGSVKITHTGPPGAFVANLTAINATGIGAHHAFNMPFFPQIPAQSMGAVSH
jgi:hypothetical protein